MQVHANERPRPGVEPPSLETIQEAARAFVQTEAGFAQVYTINREGFPVGRTMVAVLNDDWTVDLVQRNVHKRLAQIRRNPHMEVLWSGQPRPDSVNDRPHVYDFGLLVPRVVFVRGVAEFMPDEQLVEVYERQTQTQRAKGLTKAPLRDRDQIRAELVGVRLRPVQVRAEGFGPGATSFTWSTTGGAQ